MANTQEPRTLLEAVRYFSDPQTAFNFVVKLRWPNGQPTCPRCGCLEHSFLTTRRLWKCKACKRQFSVKVGTIFEDSPIGFDKWLPAVWLIANSKNSISSYEVARALGVTQKTAWFMLHRIRVAMQTQSFERMTGTVEVDETFIGGRSHNRHANVRRGFEGRRVQMPVQGARQRDGGVVRAKALPFLNKVDMQANVRFWVETGTAVYTDEAPAYKGLETHFAHKTILHSAGTYVSGDVTTNGIENFWSVLKRSIKGTQIHVSRRHLDRYVTERTFAYNYRDESDLSRMRTAVAGTVGRRLTYAHLTSKGYRY